MRPVRVVIALLAAFFAALAVCLPAIAQSAAPAGRSISRGRAEWAPQRRRPRAPYRAAWQAKTGIGDSTHVAGLPAPVIEGDDAIVVGRQDVTAIDITSGATAWTVARELGPSAPAAVVPGSGRRVDPVPGGRRRRVLLGDRVRLAGRRRLLVAQRLHGVPNDRAGVSGRAAARRDRRRHAEGGVARPAAGRLPNRGRRRRRRSRPSGPTAGRSWPSIPPRARCCGRRTWATASTFRSPPRTAPCSSPSDRSSARRRRSSRCASRTARRSGRSRTSLARPARRRARRPWRTARCTSRSPTRPCGPSTPRPAVSAGPRA